MTATPIGDQVQKDLDITQPISEPDAYEDWALADPEPVLNDDAGDKFEDVPVGDDDDQELEDDDDPAPPAEPEPEPAPEPVEPAPGERPNTP